MSMTRMQGTAPAEAGRALLTAFPLRGFDGAVAGVLTPTDIARASQASALYRCGRAR
jgi:hypothetical protein